MSHERMLKAEEQLEKEINALMRRAEILDAQQDAKHGKGKRGDALPEELQRRTTRLEKIRQARKELEAEAAASQARRRQEQAEEAIQAVEKAEAEPERKDHLQKQAERAAEKAEAATHLAIETAKAAGVEAPDLEPRAAVAGGCDDFGIPRGPQQPKLQQQDEPRSSARQGWGKSGAIKACGGEGWGSRNIKDRSLSDRLNSDGRLGDF
jgi:hypothetical protein